MLFRLWEKGERRMKCPTCGKEMETCYLESNSFLYLTRKMHPFAEPVFASSRDKIANLNTRADGTGIPVQICQACRQVSFRY